MTFDSRIVGADNRSGIVRFVGQPVLVCGGAKRSGLVFTYSPLQLERISNLPKSHHPTSLERRLKLRRSRQPLALGSSCRGHGHR